MNHTRNDVLLIGESFSPWTQKARWALEYCDVAHRYEEFVPTLSVPWLRWRMRSWSGQLSVPVARTSGGWLRGSWEIACHAAAACGDHRLGPMQSVSRWNELSEAALAEGRTRVVRAIANDRGAQAASLPPVIPAVLRGAMRPAARATVRHLDRKYAALAVPGSLHRALLATRRGLEAAGGDFLLGRFSYADIAMLVVLECVAPVAQTQPPQADVVRRHWHHAALAAAFPDLLEWRRRLLARPGLAGSQFAGREGPGAPSLRRSSAPRSP